ncbi:hypothetical protein F4680DRAFT_284521 [Xylaria scruposa]|nr:hypothetical protein F4680DRAFT_284521 [Xylaria scruposa]
MRTIQSRCTSFLQQTPKRYYHMSRASCEGPCFPVPLVYARMGIATWKNYRPIEDVSLVYESLADFSTQQLTTATISGTSRVQLIYSRDILFDLKMESDHSIEAPNNKDLRDMSLKELEVKIHEGDLSRSDLFDILMNWFNEQIKQDIVTQSQHILRDFVELLHMHGHADIEPFNLTHVDEVFDKWLEEDAVQNQAYRRRYLITQQDVHLLFSKESRHVQDSTALSPIECRHDGEDSHSLALSCEREYDNGKAEKASADLRHCTGHSTPPRAAQHSEFSGKAEIIEIDKPGPSNEFSNRDTGVTMDPNDTHVQDPDADAVRENIVIDSSSDAEMRRTAMRADRRGRKYKVHDDLEFSTPPKNYVCRRCQKSGHWIQLCPTNLDPHYDQAPAHDYRCNFCGRKGDHFATLCSKNPHEGSLAKQREHAAAETRKSRTPAKSSRRRYQHQEPPATRLQDRYRSHSPEQRARSRYRSRTPDYRRSHWGETDDYESQSRNEDDRSRRRHRDESDVSPYTARVRLTRELHMNSENTKERRSSSQSWDGPFRLERGSTTPPPVHCRRSPSMKKTRRGHRDLDKVTKSDEGRLAYDDESEIVPKSFPCPPMASPQRRMTAGSTSGEEVVSDDSERIEMKADDFLRDLAAEIMLKDENIAESIEVNAYEEESEFDGGHVIEDCTEESNCSDTATESKSPAAQTTPSPTYRLVQCPPFQPEIVSLFHARENPIINSRASRKTACQLMEKSENFQTRHSKLVHRPATVRPSVPSNTANDGIE